MESEKLIGYIATGIVSLLVGLFLERVKGKAKLLCWVPGSFAFKLASPEMVIRTDSVTIQNIGRQPSKDIEIIHQSKPDHFQFATPVDFTESSNPSGEHVIKIASLGPKEHVNLQLLSHSKLPVLLNIRSAEGKAQFIQVGLQRVWPKWVQVLGTALILLGTGFSAYWLVNAVIFLSKSIGVVS